MSDAGESDEPGVDETVVEEAFSSAAVHLAFYPSANNALLELVRTASSSSHVHLSTTGKQL
eukprot:3970843-Prymnesium_polylepis.1